MNATLEKGIQNEPVRIAQVVGKMVGGGLEATVLNYYKNIDRTKIQYDFLVDSDSTLIPQTEIERLGGKVIVIPPYQHQIKYQKELIKLFREKKYQMVYSHMNTLSVFPMFAAWKAGVPIRVAHNHSTAGKGEFKKNIMKYTLRILGKVFPTTLCACSKYAGEWMFGKKTVQSGRVQIWQNALDINKFLFSLEKREFIRKKMRIENKFVIGHVGRFIHQKNHQFLVDVFKKVHDKNPNTVLMLVGDGNLLAEIKIKVKDYGLDSSVIFTGNRDDVADLYQSMDVFILPSFYEGLGMVAVEAQIAGLPILCSDQVPSEAKICENFYYLSLNDSSNCWAKKIEKISTNYERIDMTQCATNAKYDIKEAAKKMTEWYCSLLHI